MKNVGFFIVSFSLEGYNSYKVYILQVQQMHQFQYIYIT